MISDGGVRGIWARHDLLRKANRLKRLEKYAAETGKILTESQVIALENAKEEKQAHGEIETFHPGFLFGQDTYYVGYIKGVGKIYQQTGIDTYSNVGFAKLYMDKTAITAADFLNDKVLPFFDSEQMRLLRGLDRPRDRILRQSRAASVSAIFASQRHRALAHEGLSPADQWLHRETQPDYPG